MVSKNVGKPTISHRPFPTFYNRRLQEALSNKYSYNKNYLSNLFHKVVGKTFSEALTEERLIHARESIQHTARPITVICHEVGFSNKSFFYHKYAEKFGCTPKEDRQLGKQQFLTASL
ncbi:helix-turn-helix transcriptional regulator [Loigolactobacillus coryniformis]|uniref:helix-turn-helix transcriptional regulator n=1 Tax=Loigolactobacillus coryniformis TaxID=1610 RepID=UPI00021936FA|nr:helix-turn-helix transcriptional regulator [Loigolactobacillus coryniformis]